MVYLHLVDFYGKCRWICHTWIPWVWDVWGLFHPLIRSVPAGHANNRLPPREIRSHTVGTTYNNVFLLSFPLVVFFQDFFASILGEEDVSETTGHDSRSWFLCLFLYHGFSTIRNNHQFETLYDFFWGVSRLASRFAANFGPPVFFPEFGSGLWFEVWIDHWYDGTCLLSTLGTKDRVHDLKVEPLKTWRFVRKSVQCRRSHVTYAWKSLITNMDNNIIHNLYRYIRFHDPVFNRHVVHCFPVLSGRTQHMFHPLENL